MSQLTTAVYTKPNYVLEDLIRRIPDLTAEHIEMMACAYFKETDIPPSQVELVMVNDGYKIRWYFQKREQWQVHS